MLSFWPLKSLVLFEHSQSDTWSLYCWLLIMPGMLEVNLIHTAAQWIRVSAAIRNTEDTTGTESNTEMTFTFTWLNPVQEWLLNFNIMPSVADVIKKESKNSGQWIHLSCSGRAWCNGSQGLQSCAETLTPWGLRRHISSCECPGVLAPQCVRLSCSRLQVWVYWYCVCLTQRKVTLGNLSSLHIIIWPQSARQQDER